MISRFPMVVLGLAFVLAISCSAGSTGPVGTDITPQNPQAQASPSATLLWGLWDVSIDPATGTAEIEPLRAAELTANVTMFLQPTGKNYMGVQINPPTNFAAGYVNVDVILTHPFAGLDQFTGFDVRGVCIGNGSISGIADGGIKYAGPDDLRVLNADGYTRWFNPSEFTKYDKILGFTRGRLGTPSYDWTATLNGYKYYCNGLQKDQNVIDFFTDPACENPRGYFTAGTTLRRTYEIQFPTPGGSPQIKFQYAVVASWEPPADDPPQIPDSFNLSANCQEAYAVLIADQSDMYYINDTTYGGQLALAVRVFDHQGATLPTSVSDEIAAIHLETPGGLITSGGLATFDSSALAGALIAEDEISATYRLIVTGVKPYKSGQIPVMVVIENTEPNTYNSGIPGWPFAPGSLAAYFLTNATVYTEVPFLPPVAVAEIVSTPPYVINNEIDFSASGSYDPDQGGNSIISYQWDFDEDGLYDDAVGPLASWTFTSSGIHYVNVKVTDNEGETDTLNTPLAVNVQQGEAPPVAAAKIVSVPPYCPNDPIEFDASASYDPDGGAIVSYAWDFNGDGIYGDSYNSGTDAKPKKIFGTVGFFDVDLRVTDDESATDTLDKKLPLMVGSATWVDDDAVAPYLGTFDQPWPTIQQGINNANNDCGTGKWVLVKDGTYQENITMVSNITVEGYSTPAPLITTANGSTLNMVTYGSTTNAALKHFRVKPRTTGRALDMPSASSATAEDIEFVDNPGGATCSDGIYSSAPSATIKNIRCNGYQISSGGHRTFISAFGTGAKIVDCVILNLSFTNATGGYGPNVIYMDNGNASTLCARNVIGHYLISGPTGQSNRTRVIYTGYNMKGAVIRNNLIFNYRNNTDSGWTSAIEISDIAGMTIEHNTISGVRGPAWIQTVNFYGNPTTSIMQSMIVANLTSTGSMPFWRWAFSGYPNPYMPISYSCTFSVGNDFASVNTYAGTGFLSNQNPQFLNPSGDDYRVATSSPCHKTAHDDTDMGAYGGSDPLTWLPG